MWDMTFTWHSPYVQICSNMFTQQNWLVWLKERTLLNSLNSTSEPAHLGSSICSQGCLCLLHGPKAIKCKSWLSLSLCNVNLIMYSSLLNCCSLPRLSVLHCCTGICHKLLPLGFKRVTSLEARVCEKGVALLQWLDESFTCNSRI